MLCARSVHIDPSKSSIVWRSPDIQYCFLIKRKTYKNIKINHILSIFIYIILHQNTIVNIFLDNYHFILHNLQFPTFHLVQCEYAHWLYSLYSLLFYLKSVLMWPRFALWYNCRTTHSAGKPLFYSLHRIA